MNFGICQVVKDPPLGSFTTGDLSAVFEDTSELGQPLSCRCDVVGLQIHLSKDAATKLRHSLCNF